MEYEALWVIYQRNKDGAILFHAAYRALEPATIELVRMSEWPPDFKRPNDTPTTHLCSSDDYEILTGGES